MTPLPIAVISPHGGLQVPPELVGRVQLTREQIFNEADAYANDLYDFGGRVAQFEVFPYARTILDMNRPATGDVPGRTGDGAVKLQTSYGVPVYAPGDEPGADLQRALIDRYWRPWQAKLEAIANNPEIKLVIDAHTMAAVGPSAFNDPDHLRPRVQVGNFGDGQGEGTNGTFGLSAPPELARFLTDVLGDALADLGPLTEVGAQQALNWPFPGGYQLAAHGGRSQPWLMVEVNRALYVGVQTGDAVIAPPNTERIAAVRERLWTAIAATVAQVM